MSAPGHPPAPAPADPATPSHHAGADAPVHPDALVHQLLASPEMKLLLLRTLAGFAGVGDGVTKDLISNMEAAAAPPPAAQAQPAPQAQARATPAPRAPLLPPLSLAQVGPSGPAPTPRKSSLLPIHMDSQTGTITIDANMALASAEGLASVAKARVRADGFEKLETALRGRERLATFNMWLAYGFHILQAGGVLMTAIATGYGLDNVVWAGVAVNALATLVTVLEKFNAAQSEKYRVFIQQVIKGNLDADAEAAGASGKEGRAGAEVHQL